MSGRVENARIDPRLCDEIRARIRLSELVGRIVTLKKKGREHSGLCPFHAERTPSFTVSDGKGFFHCFGCGAHGDAFGFLMRARGLSFVAAVAELAREAGVATPARHPERSEGSSPGNADLSEADKALRSAQGDEECELEAIAQREAARRERKRLEEEQARRNLTLVRARDLWRQARPIWGTAAEIYLSKRGRDMAALRRDWGERGPLRFYPALWHEESRTHAPALLAPILRATADGGRAMIGLHRTYLAPDGGGKIATGPAKKVLGQVSGGAIRLAPVGAKGHLLLGEGIETVLAAMQASGLPGWAGVSLGNLAGPGLASAQARAPLHPGRFDGRVRGIGPGGRRLQLPTTVPDMERYDRARSGEAANGQGGGGIVLPASVRRLTLLADNDAKDPESARCLIERAANRYALAGLEVAVAWPPAGMDFADLALDGGVADAQSRHAEPLRQAQERASSLDNADLSGPHKTLRCAQGDGNRGTSA